MKNSKLGVVEEVSAALAQVRQRIATAERRFNRIPGSVRLLAVSKTKSEHAIRAAFSAGQICFGESYLQEAVAKIECLHDLQVNWHFIGSIQSNKIGRIAQFFHWVHAVDRSKLLHRLSMLRPTQAPALNVCLQVNISGEQSKSGVKADELWELADYCAELPNIRLRGLMAMPARETDFATQSLSFQRLRHLFLELQARYPGLDTLSMGTSHDLEAAVAEGATMLRVGTAIFGAREYQG